MTKLVHEKLHKTYNKLARFEGTLKFFKTYAKIHTNESLKISKKHTFCNFGSNLAKKSKLMNQHGGVPKLWL